ncbi:MAG: acylphosphatase [Candidatus Bathyarchaeia archaeon]
MRVRAHVYVRGRVQGVFFRYTTRLEATGRDVTGWVRNLRDGRVEAVFEGEREDVEAMVNFCRKGPYGARVTDIRVIWEDYTGDYKGFRVLYRH